MERVNFIKSVLPVVVVSFLALGAIRAQEPWESIPFEKWGKEEVKAVLTKSPWVTKSEINLSVDRERVGSPLYVTSNALIMLRSALPIRQALLRQRQIDSKYDKMSTSEKAAFDRLNLPLVDCRSCNDYYSISIITNRTDEWQTLSLEDMKKRIFLSNESSERRYLSNFIMPSSSEVVFLFPRLNEKGEPLFTEKNRRIIFTTNMYNTNTYEPVFLSNVEFDIGGIVRQGKLVF